MAKAILISIICFLLFLSHVFIFHKFSIKRKFFTLFRIFIAVLLFYPVLFTLFPHHIKWLSGDFFLFKCLAFLHGAGLHFCLGYLFLYFIQVFDRSPSARIMIELERARSGKLSLDKLQERYNLDKKIEDDLEDMVILSCLEKKGNVYALTPKGKRQMQIFRTARNYLKLTRN